MDEDEDAWPAHQDERLEDVFDIQIEVVAIDVDGTKLRTAHGPAGGAILDARRDHGWHALGNGLAQFLGCDGIQAQGGVRAVTFDTAGRDQQRHTCGYCRVDLVGTHVFQEHYFVIVNCAPSLRPNVSGK
jgi:hypothetical protein